MPGKKMNSIKNKDQYEALKKKGMSKEKAARIANTEHPDYNSTPYEQRSRDKLYQVAKEIGIEGRSRMDKAELIAAIRKSNK